MGLNNHIFDFNLEVSKGLVPKHSTINKFGFNLDVDTGTDPETVWSAGGLYTFPSTHSRLELTSNDNDDIATTGTGARKVKVFGLDQNYNLLEEEVNMKGVAASTTSGEFIRVFRAIVTEAGSSEKNEGVVNIKHIVDNITVAEIPVDANASIGGYGQTQMAVYSVPANHKAYITNLSGAIVRSGSNRHVTIALYKRKDGVQRVIQQLSIESTGSTTFNKTYSLPLEIEEKTDVFINCLETSANNTAVFGNFGLILVDQSGKYQ